MKVIVDTSVWSGVLRKGGDPKHAEVLARLSRRGQVQLLGAVRQEVLCGVRDGAQFAQMRERLAVFPDLPLERRDYEEAAAMFNRCRSRGVQGSNTDFLICSAAIRRNLLVYTLDADFDLFARNLPVKLYRPGARKAP